MKISFVMKGAVLTMLLLAQFNSFSQVLTDQQIKTNITPISNPLQQVTALQPRTFGYNTGQYRHLGLPVGVHYGFMAEEFQQVLPELVHKKSYNFMAGKNSYKKATRLDIDTQGLIAILVAAVQEQQVQIDKLREEVKHLKR